MSAVMLCFALSCNGARLQRILALKSNHSNIERARGRELMAKKTKKLPKTPHPRGKNLRSQLWFDNPENPGMTALYLERYMNFGLTPKELRSGKPIIGIAQTGSDLSPCNRHHLEQGERSE